LELEAAPALAFRPMARIGGATRTSSMHVAGMT
jgi:hypothetical protein